MIVRVRRQRECRRRARVHGLRRVRIDRTAAGHAWRHRERIDREVRNHGAVRRYGGCCKCVSDERSAASAGHIDDVIVRVRRQRECRRRTRVHGLRRIRIDRTVAGYTRCYRKRRQLHIDASIRSHGLSIGIGDDYVLQTHGIGRYVEGHLRG